MLLVFCSCAKICEKPVIQCTKKFQVNIKGKCVYKCPSTHIKIVKYDYFGNMSIKGCRELTPLESRIKKWRKSQD